jgi:hypothetical protein
LPPAPTQSTIIVLRLGCSSGAGSWLPSSCDRRARTPALVHCRAAVDAQPSGDIGVTVGPCPPFKLRLNGLALRPQRIDRISSGTRLHARVIMLRSSSP